jgi:hypothetical protein
VRIGRYRDDDAKKASPNGKGDDELWFEFSIAAMTTSGISLWREPSEAYCLRCLDPLYIASYVAKILMAGNVMLF